jgi:hypothetical protein
MANSYYAQSKLIVPPEGEEKLVSSEEFATYLGINPEPAYLPDGISAQMHDQPGHLWADNYSDVLIWLNADDGSVTRCQNEYAYMDKQTQETLKQHDNTRYLRIFVSKDRPYMDCEIYLYNGSEVKVSQIGGMDVTITKFKPGYSNIGDIDGYFAEFMLNDVYFKIETGGLGLEDLLMIIGSYLVQ